MYIFKLATSQKRLGFNTLAEAAKFFNIPSNSFKSTTLRSKKALVANPTGHFDSIVITINGESWSYKEVEVSKK